MRLPHKTERRAPPLKYFFRHFYLHSFLCNNKKEEKKTRASQRRKQNFKIAVLKNIEDNIKNI